jgi:hypothetical protein
VQEEVCLAPDEHVLGPSAGAAGMARRLISGLAWPAVAASGRRCCRLHAMQLAAHAQEQQVFAASAGRRCRQG